MPEPTAQNPPADPPRTAQEPPEAPDAGTDTPEAPTGAQGLILGRALRSGARVWLEDLAGTGGWTRGNGVWMTRAQIEDLGPVREVLLVPVEAGPMLKAALAWRERYPDTRFLPPSDRALAAALDAATSRQPTANLAVASRGLADEGEAWQVIAALKAGNVACARTVDNDMQAFVELPDCEACDGCGKQVPPDWYGASEADPEPAGDGPGHPDGPDGPGWCRGVITNLIDRGGADATDEELEQLTALLAERDQLADQIATLDTWLTQRIPSRWHSGGAPVEIAIAMLSSWSDRGKLATERDGLRRLADGLWDQCAEVTAERDAARAELAEVTNLVEDAYRSMTEAERQRDAARAELAEVTAERDRLRELVGETGQPGWDTCSRAEAIRQAESFHESCQRLHRDLDSVKDQLQAVRAERNQLRLDLATARAERGQLREQLREAAVELGKAIDRNMTARRDGAADALEWVSDELGGSPPDVERSVLDLLGQWAAEVRTGETEIPTPRQGGDSDE